MRGDDERSSHLLSDLSPEQRVPADHSLRAIRTMTDDVLRRMSPWQDLRSDVRAARPSRATPTPGRGDRVPYRQRHLYG